MCLPAISGIKWTYFRCFDDFHGDDRRFCLLSNRSQIMFDSHKLFFCVYYNVYSTVEASSVQMSHSITNVIYREEKITRQNTFKFSVFKQPCIFHHLLLLLFLSSLFLFKTKNLWMKFFFSFSRKIHLVSIDFRHLKKK